MRRSTAFVAAFVVLAVLALGTRPRKPSSPSDLQAAFGPADRPGRVGGPALRRRVVI
jgi:hypothetical protein